MGLGTLRGPVEDTSLPKSGKHKKLFDGESFIGWEGDTNRTWRIKEGAVVGGDRSFGLRDSWVCAGFWACAVVPRTSSDGTTIKAMIKRMIRPP